MREPSEKSISPHKLAIGLIFILVLTLISRQSDLIWVAFLPPIIEGQATARDYQGILFCGFKVLLLGLVGFGVVSKARGGKWALVLLLFTLIIPLGYAVIRYMSGDGPPLHMNGVRQFAYVSLAEVLLVGYIVFVFANSHGEIISKVGSTLTLLLGFVLVVWTAIELTPYWFLNFKYRGVFHPISYYLFYLFLALAFVSTVCAFFENEKYFFQKCSRPKH